MTLCSSVSFSRMAKSCRIFVEGVKSDVLPESSDVSESDASSSSSELDPDSSEPLSLSPSLCVSSSSEST